MPCDYKKYAPYWKQFSEYIRFERAKNQCEKCDAPNGEVIERGFIFATLQDYWMDEMGARCANTGKYLGEFRSDEVEVLRYVRIVLTVAHLDREPDGVCRCEKEFGAKCAKPSHVLALCQRCHLIYDKAKHAKNRQNSLRIQKDSARRLFEIL